MITYTPTSAIIEVINVRPVLAAIANQTNDEMILFSYTATATDDDRPAQTLTFSLTNSPVNASVTGPIGPDYVILASTNLTQWTALATNLSPVTPFQFIDTGAGSFSNRSYRVRLSP